MNQPSCEGRPGTPERKPWEDGPVGPVGELLGALREDLFLVFVAERGQPGCRRDRELPGIDEAR